MSAVGVVLGRFVTVFGDLQSALWMIAGAVLSVVLAALVQLSGKVEEIRELRLLRKTERRRQEKEEEAIESETEALFEDLNKALIPVEGVGPATDPPPAYIPGPDDLPPVEEAAIMVPFRLVREGLALVFRGFKELVALGRLISWVAIIYLVLVVVAVGLKPIMRKLGVAGETAEGALIADGVLFVLTGAWFLTGIRTRRRSILFRSLETAALASVPMLAIGLAVVCESVVYGVLCLVIAGLIYVRAFL